MTGRNEMRPGAYATPVPLGPEHRLEKFDCGEPKLNRWLVAHALNNEGMASRTYVVTGLKGTDRDSVAAYYSLATGSVSRFDIPSRFRHDLPDPVPVMILGRLAVDRRHVNAGLGREMLREAVKRTAEVSRVAGVRMLLVHAIDEAAARFYLNFEFIRFPAASLTLCLPIETILAAE